MKIIYCAYGRAGLECLYILLNKFPISTDDIFVFTHETKDNKIFIDHLTNLNIEYTFEPVNNEIKKIIKFNPDYLISIYYRFIISQTILKTVNYKAINAHPSILPKYRGTKSSVWAIINKESETGITYHYINDKIDDGKIIIQKKINIDSNDTAFSLYHKLIGLFVENFEEAFSLVINNFDGFNQIGEVTYYKRELPFGGKRKISEISYKDAIFFTRAMFFPPFKGAIFIDLNGKEIEINCVSDLKKIRKLFKS
tara:strand:- start:7941 stop:8702 length:762 start_codon:yes stop_codon:yes gene_type:complete